MRRSIIAVVAVLAVAAAWGLPTPAASEDGISVYFSPSGGWTDAIIHEIGNAQETVIVQAYRISSPRFERHCWMRTSAACSSTSY